MSRHAERLLAARDTAPEYMRGVVFDAWLLPLILAALEPVQCDLLEFLLLGENNDVPVSTNDLCEALDTLPTRVGLTLSRLRRIGLIHTSHQIDEHGRCAYHVVVDWVRQADRLRLQTARELWAEAIRAALVG